MTRKIIQLSATTQLLAADSRKSDGPGDVVVVVAALCDDGTSWLIRLEDEYPPKWDRLPDIPQSDV